MNNEMIDQLRDVRPPVDYPTSPWIMFLIVAVGVLIIGGILFLLLRQRRKAVNAKHLSPKERALKELQLLEDGTARAGVDELTYVRMSEILRRYLEDEYQLRASQMTTEEFLISLQHTDKISAEIKGLLSDFLMSMDMVKFAKGDVSKDDFEQHLNDVKSIVS